MTWTTCPTCRQYVLQKDLEQHLTTAHKDKRTNNTAAKVLPLRRKGLSYGQIAARLGLSRQAVQQCLQRYAPELMGRTNQPRAPDKSPLTCPNCNKKFGERLSPSARANRIYCSKKCQYAARHSRQYEDRMLQVARMRNHNPPTPWNTIAEELGYSSGKSAYVAFYRFTRSEQWCKVFRVSRKGERNGT